jgi:hypothetical protein
MKANSDEGLSFYTKRLDATLIECSPREFR